MSGGWKNSGRKARLPASWARIRAEVLARDVTCQICHVRPATHCDHLKAKTDDDRLSQLQGVCAECHGHKSSTEGNEAQRANPRPGRRRPEEKHPGAL